MPCVLVVVVFCQYGQAAKRKARTWYSRVVPRAKTLEIAVQAHGSTLLTVRHGVARIDCDNAPELWDDVLSSAFTDANGEHRTPTGAREITLHIGSGSRTNRKLTLTDQHGEKVECINAHQLWKGMMRLARKTTALALVSGGESYEQHEGEDRGRRTEPQEIVVEEATTTPRRRRKIFDDIERVAREGAIRSTGLITAGDLAGNLVQTVKRGIGNRKRTARHGGATSQVRRLRKPKLSDRDVTFGRLRRPKREK